MRSWIIAGNWKMHNTPAQSIALAEQIRESVREIEQGEVVIAPPFTSLTSVAAVVENSRVGLAAQNVFYEDKGAFTGEVSPSMLREAGCSYVIIGHSERRKYFHETDETVNLKVKKTIAEGMKAILCVGETDDEREKGVTEFVVGIQIKKGLSGIPSLKDIVVAYEPVWAIGTGKNATPEEAQNVHSFIRAELEKVYGKESEYVRILYGGSVTGDNAGELLSMPDIDGALVGGASLKSDNFLAIIRKALETKK